MPMLDHTHAGVSQAPVSAISRSTWSEIAENRSSSRRQRACERRRAALLGGRPLPTSTRFSVAPLEGGALSPPRLGLGDAEQLRCRHPRRSAVDPRIHVAGLPPTFAQLTPAGPGRRGTSTVAAIGVYWARQHHATEDETAPGARGGRRRGRCSLDRIGLELRSLGTELLPTLSRRPTSWVRRTAEHRSVTEAKSVGGPALQRQRRRHEVEESLGWPVNGMRTRRPRRTRRSTRRTAARCGAGSAGTLPGAASGLSPVHVRGSRFRGGPSASSTVNGGRLFLPNRAPACSTGWDQNVTMMILPGRPFGVPTSRRPCVRRGGVKRWRSGRPASAGTGVVTQRCCQRVNRSNRQDRPGAWAMFWTDM